MELMQQSKLFDKKKLSVILVMINFFTISSPSFSGHSCTGLILTKLGTKSDLEFQMKDQTYISF